MSWDGVWLHVSEMVGAENPEFLMDGLPEFHLSGEMARDSSHKFVTTRHSPRVPRLFELRISELSVVVGRRGAAVCLHPSW
jgi:hypothetical protein